MWYALGYTYSIVRAPGKYKRVGKALFYEFYIYKKVSITHNTSTCPKQPTYGMPFCQYLKIILSCGTNTCDRHYNAHVSQIKFCL